MLEEAVRLAGSGEFDPGVTGVYPLERAAGAHRVFENRAASGKLILAILLIASTTDDDLRAGSGVPHPHPDRVGDCVAVT